MFRHQLGMQLFQYLLVAWAPKSHIGGSGMTASRGVLHTPRATDWLCSSMAFFDKAPYPACCWIDCPTTPSLPWIWAVFELCTRRDSIQQPRRVYPPFSPSSAWAPKSLIGGSGLTASREVFCQACIDVLTNTCATDKYGSTVVQSACSLRAIQPGREGISAPAHMVRHPDHGTRTATPWILVAAGAFLVPLARGLLALVFLGVLRLYIGTRRAHTSLLGRVCGLPLRGRCGDVVVPLGKATRPDAILDWSILKSRRNRRPGSSRQCLWRTAFGSLGIILGIPVTPVPFVASPSRVLGG